MGNLVQRERRARRGGENQPAIASLCELARPSSAIEQSRFIRSDKIGY
jgi:hypothetical protein